MARFNQIGGERPRHGKWFHKKHNGTVVKYAAQIRRRDRIAPLQAMEDARPDLSAQFSTSSRNDLRSAFNFADWANFIA
jgi:hypothetical protein